MSDGMYRMTVMGGSLAVGDRALQVVSGPNPEECGILRRLTITWMMILGCNEDIVYCETEGIVIS